MKQDIKTAIKIIRTGLAYGWSYGEIGEKLGVSKQYVHQLVVKHEIVVKDRGEEIIEELLRAWMLLLMWLDERQGKE